MSRMTELLLEKYGPTLDTTDLAEVLKYKSEKCVLNSISSGAFPIPTAKSGKRRIASVFDVADFLKSA